MIHIAIVDDDVEITSQITEYIQMFGRENKLELASKSFHHPNDFLEQYEMGNDLVILDIEMPCINGIQTARELRYRDPAVLIMFITNMAQFALESYSVDAIDYVLKPLGYGDFSMKMQKVIRYMKQNHDQKIKIRTELSEVLIPVSDILYLEVIRHRIIYHTVFGIYEEYGVMGEKEKLLVQLHFFRCHRCFLINMKHVNSISDKTVLVGTDELSVSRGRRKALMEFFTNYLGGFQ